MGHRLVLGMGLGLWRLCALSTSGKVMDNRGSSNPLIISKFKVLFHEYFEEVIYAFMNRP